MKLIQLATSDQTLFGLTDTGRIFTYQNDEDGWSELDLPKEMQAEKVETPKVDMCPYTLIVNAYHNRTVFPRVRRLTAKRKANIRSRWTHGLPNISAWDRYFIYADESSFLCGGNDRNWVADLEWLTTESNYAKVIEGKYHADR